MAKVVVGGREYPSGGWVDYEIQRREGGGVKYEGKTVTIDDVLNDIVCSACTVGSGSVPLCEAIANLGRKAEEICKKASCACYWKQGKSATIIPPQRIQRLISGLRTTPCDLDLLADLCEVLEVTKVETTVLGVLREARQKLYEEFPHPISTDDSKALRAAEAACERHGKAIESCVGALATSIDACPLE